MAEIKYEIKKNYGQVSESAKGWLKELNLVSWNDKEPKFDLREWDSSHQKMGRGITFNAEEIKKLKDILNNIEI